MTPYQWILLAGAVGTFVIIWQNWLSFQDTRVDLENRLRERMKGRGNREGKVAASVDEVRVYELSRLAKLKWYLGRGIDSGVEVKVETNLNLDDSVWNKVEEMFDRSDIEFAEVEHLGTNPSPQGKTSLSVLRVDSTDESEIMEVVCAVPFIVNLMDLTLEPDANQSPMPFDLPDEYEEELEGMM